VRVASLMGPPVPVPVEVALDRQGLPSRLALGGQTYYLLNIVDQWREEQGWWHRPLRRDYFRVTMPDESHRKIFQDLQTGDWYLDRSWPLL
jgi:hypothetical protein